MSKRLTLVLGGVRAGKSRYAQTLAQAGQRVLVVATAEAGDEEMAARIQAHRAERPAAWDTLEEPIDVATALAPRLPSLRHRAARLPHPLGQQSAARTRRRRAGRSRHLRRRPPPARTLRRWRRLLDRRQQRGGPRRHPANELARSYADELGRVNQIFAAAADDVILMVAGVPVSIKALNEGRERS